MKIKLAIDCRMYHASGIGTYLKNMLPALVNTKRYSIICLGFDDLLSETWIRQVKFIRMESKPLHPMEQWELFRKIPACDILWCPHFNAPVVLPARVKKLVVTIHDIYHLANAKEYSFFVVKYVKYLLRSAISKAAHIITVSEFSKSEIIKFFPKTIDKLSVIYLGVSSIYQHNDHGHTKGNYLLYVGNVKPHKNIQLIIRALKLLADSSIKLVVVGRLDGFYKGDSELKELCAQMNNQVIFTGFVDDKKLIEYYQNATAFIFPSKYEGFGLPVLEAMKFDLPILASNAASIPEVGGSAITYFDPENVAQLADLIKQMFAGELHFNFDLYRERILKFKWEKTVEAHLKIFVDILT